MGGLFLFPRTKLLQQAAQLEELDRRREELDDLRRVNTACFFCSSPSLSISLLWVRSEGFRCGLGFPKGLV